MTSAAISGSTPFQQTTTASITQTEKAKKRPPALNRRNSCAIHHLTPIKDEPLTPISPNSSGSPITASTLNTTDHEIQHCFNSAVVGPKNDLEVSLPRSITPRSSGVTPSSVAKNQTFEFPPMRKIETETESSEGNTMLPPSLPSTVTSNSFYGAIDTENKESPDKKKSSCPCNATCSCSTCCVIL